MAAGGSITSIIMLVVMLYILVEFVFPLGKKLVSEITSMRAKAYVTRSYM